MKRHLTSALILAALAVGAFFTSRYLSSSGFQPVIPYTILYNWSNGHTERSYYEAVRTDGSRVYGNLYRGTDGQLTFGPKRVTLADQAVHKIVGSGNAVSTAPIDRTFAGNMSHVHTTSDCETPGFEILGYEKYLGLDVVKQQVESEEQGIKQTIWKAPAINCQIVRKETEERGYIGVTEAVSIAIGEPSPDLFSSPEDAEEVPPSELVFREALKSFKGNPPGDLSADEKLHDLDDAYYKAKSKE